MLKQVQRAWKLNFVSFKEIVTDQLNDTQAFRGVTLQVNDLSKALAFSPVNG